MPSSRSHIPTNDDGRIQAILDTAVVDADPVLREFESSAVAAAFNSLPERWQAVLWHVDIEGMKPAAAAPFIGISPNGVSSLLIRAREGLRQAYLQNHVVLAPGDECSEYSGHVVVAFPRTCSLSSSSRCGHCSRTKSGPSAPSWACRR